MIIFFIQKSQHTVTIDNSIYTEKIDDTKTVIRGHKLMNRQYNGERKKDKQCSSKHYTEN